MGISLDDLNIVATIENPEAVKRSVKSGLGITIIQDLRLQMRSSQEKFWNSRFHRLAAVET